MTRANDRPDDGTSEWAAEAAAGFIGVAMLRADKEGGATKAAETLGDLSGFISSMIWENPRIAKARVGNL